MPFLTIAIALIFVVAIARIANIYLPMPPLFRAVTNVVLALIAVGMALWVIDTYIPMAGAIRALLNVVVFIAALIGVLQAFGAWDSTRNFFRNLRHKAETADTHLPGERVPR